MRKIMKRITSVTLILAVTVASVCDGGRIHGVTPAVKKVSAAEADMYIKTVLVSNASSKKDAEEEFGNEYTVLDTDFGKSSGTHAWIGYATTEDPGLAITDLKVMDMEGQFNYSDYKELLKKQKKEVDEQMNTVLPAVKEYAKNYDAGYLAAIRMKDVLNALYEDDSEKGMGDYLLDAGHALNKNANDKAVLEDLTKVFMQGSDDAIQLIESVLIQTLGGKLKQGSWLERMSEMGPDGLQKIYKQAYPKESNSAIKKHMKEDLNDYATLILENLPAIRENFSDYEASELGQAIESQNEDAIDAVIEAKMNRDSTLVDDSMTENEAIDAVADSIDDAMEAGEAAGGMVNATLKVVMEILPYGDDTNMYDFFMREDLKVEDLYPMAYLLSNAQKNLMEDVGLYGMFVSALAAINQNEADPEDSEAIEDMINVSQSIYEGVDRGMFESDTAITGPAMQRMQTTETTYFTQNTYYNLGIFSLVVIGIVGFWKCFDNKVIDGYIREIDLNNPLQSAKYTVTLDKIKLEYSNYSEAMQEKFKSVRFNCMKNELQYLEANNYLKGMRIDYNKLSSKIYKEALKKLSSADKARLYAKNGPMAKWQNTVAQQKIKTEAKINKAWNKCQSKKDILYRKTDAKKATFLNRYGARIVTVVAFAAAIAMAAYEIYNMVNGEKTKITYSDIDMPMRMVDRTYPTGAEEITYVSYTAGLKADGKKADLHNWKGDLWLNIYTTTDPDAGDPISVEDFGVRDSATNADQDMYAVTRFGDSDAYDVVGNNGYLFFKRIARAGSDEKAEEIVSEQSDSEDTQDLEADAETPESDTAETQATVFGDLGCVGLILLIVVVVLGAIAGIYLRKKTLKESSLNNNLNDEADD
ncbi:MAG: hypothetical protein K6G65_10615 [Lachnospiraceae bacterium]|nr:hypothetical protein [Lachnospiraceae bacterium]